MDPVTLQAPQHQWTDALGVACGVERVLVHEDENVRVTAILVEHPPVAPAFAFRFDTAEGSVTISGDTAPTQNLVRLARDTDLLMHEAIDFDWVRRGYAQLPRGSKRLPLV